MKTVPIDRGPTHCTHTGMGVGFEVTERALISDGLLRSGSGFANSHTRAPPRERRWALTDRPCPWSGAWWDGRSSARHNAYLQSKRISRSGVSRVRTWSSRRYVEI
eukprot:3554157-Prymnesium_polylepis.1